MPRTVNTDIVHNSTPMKGGTGTDTQLGYFRYGATFSYTMRLRYADRTPGCKAESSGDL